MRWLRRRLIAEERGSALVEFVFIALVVFVPLVYIVAGFSAVQLDAELLADLATAERRRERAGEGPQKLCAPDRTGAVPPLLPVPQEGRRTFRPEEHGPCAAGGHRPRPSPRSRRRH